MFQRIRRRLGAVGLAVIMVASVAGCSLFRENNELVRSDPPTNGYVASMLYNINASPDGASETNQIVYRGMNGESPMPLLSTSFGKGASSRTQLAQLTTADGTVVNVLSMNRRTATVGLTEYLDAAIATYEQRDILGNRACGAKVRLNFKPNIAQVVMDDRYRRAWDALFYYSVPCGEVAQEPQEAVDPSVPAEPVIERPNLELDLSQASMLALVINQQFTPRVTGKPIIYNRGHSVTIVGGRAADLRGGWWEYPVSLKSASDMIIEMVADLDAHEWLSFGEARNGGLVYSAGDADVYLSLERIFLNRQVEYLVNFRSSPSEPWKRVRIVPVYNFEWNDFTQNYEALKGEDMPDIDEMVDQNTGLPKDIGDPGHEKTIKLKEIETAGCQNCPNPTLEQVQFVDATEGSPTNGQPLYALTIRGYLGSHSSLVMFGEVPGSLDGFMQRAENHRQQQGMTECPIQRNEKGEPLEDNKQYSPEDCANWLREGALWDMLTQNPNNFGFDVVGQFQVRDNSTWASHCSGSGEYTYCNLVATNRRLDASYLFTDAGDKLAKAWTILQLLGEVGMRTFGFSYASGAYDGNGLDFAMAQPRVYNTYYTNMADPDEPYNIELLFGLDARALQLPATLGEAAEYLGLN